MSIKKNLIRIREEIPSHVKLVAISKTKPVEIIQEAYEVEQRVFGENRTQELTEKQPICPKDIEWHFVGHLQRNKVKSLVPFVHLIHAVDSLRLLVEIDKEARKINRTINCLLQFYIAEEETKFGLDLEEAKNIINSDEFPGLNNIQIAGVMGMASFTEDEEQIRKEFRFLKNTFDFLKRNYFPDNDAFKEISMGMTNDYHIAIEEGSTMLRIGSAIFGTR